MKFHRMEKHFVEELRWRGLLHDMVPDTAKHLQSKMRVGYTGFDPTADALHVGSLIPLIILKHFQNHGHRPVIVIGGATGMIGDPSGKSKERNLLDATTLKKNIDGIKTALTRFLNFDNNIANTALLVNNYDWMKKWLMIDFLRDIGKILTVNYMTAKDSVKKRMNDKDSDGISFTEFSYQLFQGYDFLHLYQNLECTIQMGGSDQWGNIITGVELIRKKEQGKAYALTTPLITKSDGSKFGKSEEGNIWLDQNRTSVYQFYQFWLNISDQDSEGYIKKFTFLTKETIVSLIEQHRKKPHTRLLQKTLAKEITIFVHGKDHFEKALQASNILFGKSTEEDLKCLDETTFLEVFQGVPRSEITQEILRKGINIIDAFSSNGFLRSNATVRREIKGNAISVNKNKVNTVDFLITKESLIAERYVLLQHGKKKYFLLQLAKN